MPLSAATLALVEDDPIMGESLVQRLGIEGAKVTWWRTRADTLRGLTVMKPDAVICDIRLPDGSGEDIFREVGTHERAPAFLFMTAFADIDQAVRLMKAGAGDYIIKPFEMATLMQRLVSMLNASKPRITRVTDLKGARGEADRAMIEQALFETDGKIGAAAARLKVSRTTLWGRMKALAMETGENVRKTEHRK
ncbi:MAG: response regulator [Bosea sp. (in: a-proteobacteria)]